MVPLFRFIPNLVHEILQAQGSAFDDEDDVDVTGRHPTMRTDESDFEDPSDRPTGKTLTKRHECGI